MTTFRHIPVMLGVTVDLLNVSKGKTYIDCTLGGGGHSGEILKRLNGDGMLYGIDRDAQAISAAREALKGYENFCAVKGNYCDIVQLMREKGVRSAGGILFDLGVSSHQLDSIERGFSYHYEAPLDMRMDASSGITAETVVNTYAENELVKIIRDYGEERYAVRIAHRIVREREKQPIQTTLELAEIIKKATPIDKRYEGKHPARRTFQAIRIEVNGEIEKLEGALTDAKSLLNKGGRMVVITFHSLEDRIVKRLFREWENPCTCDPKAPICVCGKRPEAKTLTRKPIVADESEQNENQRSRSAKIRAIEKL